MKKNHYFYLLILVLITLVSCNSTNITKHTEDIYFYNHLDKTIKVEIFNGDGMLNCEVAPHDTAFFTTIEFSMEEDVTYDIYPGELAYNNFLMGINKINLYYGSEKYVYSEEHRDDIINLLHLERYWDVYFDESKNNHYGWEE